MECFEDTKLPYEPNEVVCMLASEGVEPLDHLYVVLARAQGVRSVVYALAHVNDIEDPADDVEVVILPEHLIYAGTGLLSRGCVTV